MLGSFNVAVVAHSSIHVGIRLKVFNRVQSVGVRHVINSQTRSLEAGRDHGFLLVFCMRGSCKATISSAVKIGNIKDETPMIDHWWLVGA